MLLSLKFKIFSNKCSLFIVIHFLDNSSEFLKTLAVLTVHRLPAASLGFPLLKPMNTVSTVHSKR